MVYLLVTLAWEQIHISMWTDSHCHSKPLLAYECYYAINCFWYLTDFFYFLPPNLFLLGQQPCFNASICLSNNVTIYCIIVLYSHFMLSHSPWHYLKIVKTLSEKFLPEGKWETQMVQPGYHEKAQRLKSCHAFPVWPPSWLRLRHSGCMY